MVWIDLQGTRRLDLKSSGLDIVLDLAKPDLCRCLASFGWHANNPFIYSSCSRCRKAPKCTSSGIYFHVPPCPTIQWRTVQFSYTWDCQGYTVDLTEYLVFSVCASDAAVHARNEPHPTELLLVTRPARLRSASVASTLLSISHDRTTLCDHKFTMHVLGDVSHTHWSITVSSPAKYSVAIKTSHKISQFDNFIKRWLSKLKLIHRVPKKTGTPSSYR